MEHIEHSSIAQIVFLVMGLVDLTLIPVATISDVIGIEAASAVSATS